MKKLILLELAFLFLATTFSSNPPTGWYQQTLPVSDQINDIFFLDSLNGWLVTNSENGTTDSSYIMRTTNGGDIWEINYQTFVQFTAIQFVNPQIGYACGISSGPELFKSTNSGINWQVLNVLNQTWKSDLDFVNKDTGWVCSSDAFDGGVFKTTDGGQSWQREMNSGIDNPQTIFFLNKDSGWTGSQMGTLWITTNGGANWNVETNLGSIKSILFVNKDTGWVSVGWNNNIRFTSNGGQNWIYQIVPPKSDTILFSRPIEVSTVDGKTVWSVGGNIFFGMGRVRGIIYKSTDSGNNWFYQLPDTSINIGVYNNIQFINDSVGWASYGSIIHTKDGGGPLVSINNQLNEISKDFNLNQNYPNPFNPKTIISYKLQISGNAQLKVYDIRGKEVGVLLNEKQNAGNYEIEFNGSSLSSGVYFYRLVVTDEKSKQIYSETKKMILTK